MYRMCSIVDCSCLCCRCPIAPTAAGGESPLSGHCSPAMGKEWLAVFAHFVVVLLSRAELKLVPHSIAASLLYLRPAHMR